MSDRDRKAADRRAAGPGRRERQKAARSARILRAADVLFARRGYEGTTMGDVARRARVAVGTLYNYFPSKSELVLALLERETGESLAEGEKVLARPPAEPLAAIGALFDVYLDLLTRRDRGTLRELMAAAVSQPDSVGRGVFAADLSLVQQLTRLLEALREAGQLRADLEAGRAAVALYGVLVTWMLVYLGADGFEASAFRSEVHRGVALTVDGLGRGAA